MPSESLFSFPMSKRNGSYCVYPCPCGYYGDAVKPCTCASSMVTKYQKRISGPLLDRIDIHIEVPRVDYEKLSSDRVGETSESIRQRVQAARDIQNKRFGIRNLPTSAQNQETLQSVICNADMRVGEVRQFCSLKEEGQSLMRSAMTQLNLSARAYHRWHLHQKVEVDPENQFSFIMNGDLAISLNLQNKIYFDK